MSARALTLLETLLTLALLMLLASMTMAFFRETRAIGASIRTEVEAVNAARVLMSRLTVELRSALLLPEAPLRGDSGSLRLAVAVWPSPVPAAWDAGDAEAPATLEAGWRVIRYSLRYSDTGETSGDDAMLTPVGIERSSELPRLVTLNAPAGSTASRLVTDQLRFLALRYWQDNDWVTQWSADHLPAAVEIRLGELPLPEGMDPADYPYSVFRRVVWLPAGGPLPTVTGAAGAGPDSEDVMETEDAVITEGVTP